MENFPSNINALHREVKPRSDLYKALSAQPEVLNTEQNVVKIKDISSHLHSFTLPSLGKFYGGKKELFMKELRVDQAIRLSEIQNIKDEGERLAKLSTIVESSITGIKAVDLTLPDFYAVCYELRTISGESPMVVEREIMGRKFSKALVKESFTVDYLDEDVDTSKYDFPRVRDKIESSSERNKTKFTDIDCAFFGYVHGLTAEEKLENFRSLSYTELDDLIINCTKLVHGLSDKVKLYSEQGDVEEVEVRFDPIRLLPSSFLQLFHRDNI
jgi:hypothetical protein